MRRQTSREYKKKQFQLRQDRLKKWRQEIVQRRAARAAYAQLQQEMEKTLPIFAQRRKRRASSSLECPLETCPKKVKILAKLKKLEALRKEDESDDSSLVSRISNQSIRHRSPLRVIRPN